MDGGVTGDAQPLGNLGRAHEQLDVHHAAHIAGRYEGPNNACSMW